MKRLDEQIRAAFHALEASVPDGYFDEFASRVDARLEEQAMNGTDMSDVDGDKNRGIPPVVSAETKDTWEDDEHSGLAEITELASRTKSQITRRASTQSEAESAMLLSASHSGLSQVVLPEPGKGTSNFDDADEAAASTGKRKSGHSAVATATSAGLDEDTRSGMPVWIYGAVGLVAAAAVVFFVMRGGKADEAKVASSTGDNNGQAAPGDSKGQATPTGQPGAVAGAPAKKQPAVVATNAPDSVDTKTDSDPTKDGTGAETGVDPAAGGKADPPAVATKVATNVPTNVPTTKNATTRPNVARRKAPKTTKSAPAKNNKTATRTKTTKARTRKSNKPKKDQSVEDLLGQFDESKGKKVVKKVAKKPSKKTLSRSDVRRGMRGVASRVQGCYNAHKKSGLVMIQVKLTGGGKLSASATGGFAGTPTGKCVASAVRLARFPKFSGAPMSFPYPFRLNP